MSRAQRRVLKILSSRPTYGVSRSSSLSWRRYTSTAATVAKEAEGTWRVPTGMAWETERDAYGHPRQPLRGHYEPDKCEARRQWVEKMTDASLAHTGEFWANKIGDPLATTTRLRGNVENVIGLAKVPVGIAGPLLVRGEHVNGYVLVPYATTEGALIASATRGAAALMRAGGARTRTLKQRLARAPVFRTGSVDDAMRLGEWLQQNIDGMRNSIRETSQHAKLVEIETFIDGRSLVAVFQHETGDAAGQNMTTSTTWKACQWALNQLRREESNIHVEAMFAESKFSGDKAASPLLFTRPRGTGAVAEVFIPESVMTSTLKVSTDTLITFYNEFEKGAKMVACGSNVQALNAITSIFLATGQDVASSVESAGATLCCQKASPEELARYQAEVGANEDLSQSGEGGLYASITIPTMTIGTVGGGTSLPTQKEALTMLGCQGKGGVKRLAEIIAASTLGSELSCIAALASGQFASSHDRLGRNRPDLGLKQSHISDELFSKVVQSMGQLVSWSPSNVDASASILSDLSKSELSKVVGHFAFDVTYQPHGEADGVHKTLRVVMKSKATYKETCMMLNKLAQGCGLSLATNYEFYKMRTGFAHCDRREIEMLALDDERIASFRPKTYHAWQDAEKDLFVIFMENFDYMENVHTANDPSVWTDSDIKLVLKDAASFHSIHYGNVDVLLEKPWMAAPSSREITDLTLLWGSLLDHNMAEFPELWQKDRSRLATRIINNIDTIWLELEQAPRTLVHNDLNTRNICINPGNGGKDRRRLCAYDWELATVNVPQRDLAEFLAFVLPPDTSIEKRRSYVEFHRQELEKATGHKINPAVYQRHFDMVSCDFAINRLALYSMAHTFKHYTFYPRVLSSHMNYLLAVASKGQLDFLRQA